MKAIDKTKCNGKCRYCANKYRCSNLKKFIYRFIPCDDWKWGGAR